MAHEIYSARFSADRVNVTGKTTNGTIDGALFKRSKKTTGCSSFLTE